ncbi:DUF58 domain-containing protein [Methyloceanibacter sp. wino2]|uniref:DUF58 domain-containing protein n=1 Tax=Methyloceanibacter sp. wino2 TaxID=2170729 RepID=UPI000D3E6098|nr:hypothetical protein [Methyloceanibacter sp. wino2]
MSTASHEASSAIDVPYRLAWRAAGVRIGAHQGKMEGAGGLFKDHELLVRARDPRRIDLRVSLRDPFGNLYAKRFSQRSAITVYALVDLSASMGFLGQARIIDVATDLCAALAGSARRIGDTFGLIGANRRIVPTCFWPATASRGAEAEMLTNLRAFDPAEQGELGDSAEGLVDAAAIIAGRRKLVFLISDFLMPEGTIEAIFEALAGHDVIPIVLRDPRELEDLPRYGLVSFADLETGRRRLYAMRPALRAALIADDAERSKRLRSLAMRYGRPPFEIVGKIDWDRFGAYLMGEVG